MPRKPLVSWWFAFWVRFIFGAMLGLLLGFSFWMCWLYGVPGGWIVVPSSVIALGIAAGYWGDDLWHNLRDWIWWWS